MNIIRFSLVGLALLFSISLSYAHGEKTHHDMTPPDSLAVSMAFDHQGKLWRVSINDGFVEVTSSTNLGKTFSKSVHANTVKQNITAHGEVRPKIAIGKSGEIYVTWMQNLNARFSAYIWFARSVNGGKSFEKPDIVHTDRAEISHAFEELQVAPDGKITVLWLDARDAESAKKAGKKRSGSSIYYAVSTDAGKTFTQEKKLADNSCECCRIATTSKLDGTMVAMWRHVFEGGERDHNIAEIPKDGMKPEAHRASFGRWVIDGCPHQGGALALGAGFGYHMAYFDGQDKKPGLYVSRMDGEAWVTSPAKKFGDNSKSASHPDLLSMGENVWLVWRETQGTQHQIFGMTSDDGGRSWNEAKLLTKADGKVDYPFLMANKKQVYLSWNTANGLQIMPLN